MTPLDTCIGSCEKLPGAKTAQEAQNHRCAVHQRDAESECGPEAHGRDSQPVLNKRRLCHIPADPYQDGRLGTDQDPADVVEMRSLPKPPPGAPAHSFTASYTTTDDDEARRQILSRVYSLLLSVAATKESADLDPQIQASDAQGVQHDG